MSAETIRRAAALMRERASTATEGAWDSTGGTIWGRTGLTVVQDPDMRREDREHIASWHPTTAFAVADWLDATAAEHESVSGNPTIDDFFAAFDTAPDVAAIAVARAYLGETA